MEGEHPSATDRRLALRHGAAIARRCAEVVSGREQMTGVEADAHVRAGMDDDAREAKRLGALELVGEGVDRLRPERRVRVAEVDEIARVREDVTDRVSPARGPELADLVRRERLRRPLPLIFQEDLDRAAAQLATA